MRRTRQLRWLARASSSKSRTILDPSCACSSGLIPLRDAQERTSTAQRGAASRPRQQRQASHLSPRKQRRRRYHPLSVVQQLLSTTRTERATVRVPPSRTEQPQKKLLSTAPEFADAATQQQRCSPSSREQQDSPSRSRRARPSRATRGTSFPSVVKCARRRRRTAACSARCDEEIH